MVRPIQALSRGFARWGDRWVIDQGMVHGLARWAMMMGRSARALQTGYLYHYAMVMVLGLLAFLIWWL